MMISAMRTERYKTDMCELALIFVLFVVVTITIFSWGFLWRSDMELGCGQNIVVLSQMAELGYKHTGGLVLSRQYLGDNAYRPLYTMRRKIRDMFRIANYSRNLYWFNSFYGVVLTIVPILLALTVVSMRDDVYIGFACVGNQGRMT